MHQTKMELPWLYSFTVLADLLHFGRAAAALHMSQSALSVQIRNLEASLKVTLFERDRRSVALTVAGQVFLEDVHRLLRELAILGSSADEPRLRKFLTTAVQLQPGSARSAGKR
jgi:DNA-binding transcriptional LysR family regulator